MPRGGERTLNGAGSERRGVSLTPSLSPLTPPTSMLKRLVQRATATAGLLTGPATQPERYRLIEEISRPNKNHPSVYLGRAPYAWTAVDTQYVLTAPATSFSLNIFPAELKKSSSLKSTTTASTVRPGSVKL